MLGVRRNRSSCSATALAEANAPQGLSQRDHKLRPCQNFDSPAWYTSTLNEPALGWQFDSRVTDSEMEQRLTLREALAEDRLAEFVRQEEGRGVELANGSELERALALLITKRRVHVGPLLPSDSYACR
jgi:hypothetical protein